jgi:hypothetical protein
MKVVNKDGADFSENNPADHLYSVTKLDGEYPFETGLTKTADYFRRKMAMSVQ